MKWKPEEVPNLDAMTSEDLGAFWAKTHSKPVSVARAMFPDRPSERRAVVETLGAYAISKVAAMRCREHGKIEKAQRYERACDIYYDDLPEWARW